MLKKFIDWFTDDNVVLRTPQYFKQDEAPKQLFDGDVWDQEKTGHTFMWNGKTNVWEFVPPLGVFSDEKDSEGRWIG